MAINCVGFITLQCQVVVVFRMIHSVISVELLLFYAVFVLLYIADTATDHDCHRTMQLSLLLYCCSSSVIVLCFILSIVFKLV